MLTSPECVLLFSRDGTLQQPSLGRLHFTLMEIFFVLNNYAIHLDQENRINVLLNTLNTRYVSVFLPLMHSKPQLFPPLIEQKHSSRCVGASKQRVK